MSILIILIILPLIILLQGPIILPVGVTLLYDSAKRTVPVAQARDACFNALLPWLKALFSLDAGFNALFTWLKAFAYLRFLNKQADMFVKTLALAAVNLTVFFFLLSIIFW